MRIYRISRIKKLTLILLSFFVTTSCPAWGGWGGGQLELRPHVALQQEQSTVSKIVVSKEKSHEKSHELHDFHTIGWEADDTGPAAAPSGRDLRSMEMREVRRASLACDRADWCWTMVGLTISGWSEWDKRRGGRSSVVYKGY